MRKIGNILEYCENESKSNILSLSQSYKKNSRCAKSLYQKMKIMKI